MSTSMPILARIKETAQRERLLRDRSVLLNMHLTGETVILGECLAAAGAGVWYLPSNRHPAPKAVQARAADCGHVLARDRALDQELGRGPFFVVEGNGRLFSLIHDAACDSLFARQVVGLSMHTSGGGRLVDQLEHERFRIPVLAIYRDPLKGRLETGLGTAHSTLGALLRGFGAPFSGKCVAVVGFGNVGSGVAWALRALGARISVVDTAPEKQLAAQLAGFWVQTLEESLEAAELCVTTTGAHSVVAPEQLRRCRPGLVLANVSNAPDEIDLTGSRCLERDGPLRSRFVLPSGQEVILLGDGAQVNHALGHGNAARVMDLSFALHALSLQWLALEPQPAGVVSVPGAIRGRVSALAMETFHAG